MKKSLRILASVLLLSGATHAQYYSPVSVSGYNMDAIAENVPASGTTTGILDGSDYVLYTASYATAYMSGTGLPNTGAMVSGYKSYQLGNYTQNNVLYVPALTRDSLGLNTPASFASISLLATSTEGSATVNVILKFTDGSSSTYNNLTISDWFDGGNSLFSGFDRVGRVTGSVDNSFSAPYLYGLEVNLSCTDQVKQLQRIVVINTGNNARACVFAVSGMVPATYTVTENDIACYGYTNGSAVVTRSGGMPSFTYSWNTTPVQHTATASGLSAGTYTCTVTDGTGCTSTHVATITEPAEQLITLVASEQLVCPGDDITLTANGAVSYDWNIVEETDASIIVTPTANTTYTVIGTMANNCLVSESVAVSVYTTPVITFVPLHDTLCVDWANMALVASPTGGIFSGNGVTGTGFNPTTAGVGTSMLTYTITDANDCVSDATAMVIVENCSTNGLSETEQDAVIYPNPASTHLLVAYPGMQAGDIFTICNLAGQQLERQQLQITETVIPLVSLSAGMYLYTVSNTAGQIISQGKFRKQ